MKTNVETAQSKQNVFYFKFNVTVRGEPVGTGPTPDIRTVDTCRLVRYETSVEIVFRKKKKRVPETIVLYTRRADAR